MEGDFPSKPKAMVKEFILKYQKELEEMWEKYPQLGALRDRDLFCAGKLTGPYGIVWNDQLDIEAETIYEEGTLVRTQMAAPNIQAGEAVYSARARAGLSQTDLSAAMGIDQSDISKIERGIANPSISTLKRIADALNCELRISIV